MAKSPHIFGGHAIQCHFGLLSDHTILSFWNAHNASKLTDQKNEVRPSISARFEMAQYYHLAIV